MASQIANIPIIKKNTDTPEVNKKPVASPKVIKVDSKLNSKKDSNEKKVVKDSSTPMSRPVSQSQVSYVAKQNKENTAKCGEEVVRKLSNVQVTDGREISAQEVRELVSTPKEYPDSDEESNEKEQCPLQYGTISRRQAELLEQLYRRCDRFPCARIIKEFVEKHGVAHADVELWLESRRELTYRKFQKNGLDTQPSVIKFYCEALKAAEGTRLEQPSIRSKSFFSHEGVIKVEAKKEEQEKLMPSIEVSSNKIFVNPLKEEKCLVTIRNNGVVNIVYQIRMMNSEKYLMSPICAILHRDEELTLHITRKPGSIDDDFFSIDYGSLPSGIIDAREAANRSDLCRRQVIEVVPINAGEMKNLR